MLLGPYGLGIGNVSLYSGLSLTRTALNLEVIGFVSDRLGMKKKLIVELLR